MREEEQLLQLSIRNLDLTLFSKSNQQVRHSPGIVAQRLRLPFENKTCTTFSLTSTHIRNTPNRVSEIGAFSAAEKHNASTRRVSAGVMMPSSHNRAVA